LYQGEQIPTATCPATAANPLTAADIYTDNDKALSTGSADEIFYGSPSCRQKDRPQCLS